MYLRSDAASLHTHRCIGRGLRHEHKDGSASPKRRIFGRDPRRRQDAGTIDAIATDHAPHHADESAEYDRAPFGIMVLETAVRSGL